MGTEKKVDTVVAVTQPKSNSDLDAEVGTCGDGSQYCDEVCCWNGNELAGCCSFAYPVCDVPHGQCHSSFEALMLANPTEKKVDTVVVATQPKSNSDLDAEVGTCGDGSSYCDEVCCWNGNNLAFCCWFSNPVCDVPHYQCHTSFEALMLANPAEMLVV